MSASKQGTGQGHAKHVEGMTRLRTCEDWKFLMLCAWFFEFYSS